MLKDLVTHPAYIFKFAIYILFICMAAIIYFSDRLDHLDKSLKVTSTLLILVYGIYRLVRTYQDFTKELREERNGQ